MVDLVVTAANVVAGSGAVIENGVAGASIVAGQTVYRDSATKRYLLADADAVASQARPGRGVALNAAGIGQRLAIITEGNLNPGATLAVGVIYVQSDTPGGIMPAADLEAGDFVTILGVASSAANLKVDIRPSGVAFA